MQIWSSALSTLKPNVSTATVRQSKRRRRPLFFTGLFFAIFGLLYLLPMLPQSRAWLLEKVQTAARSSGLEFRYRDSTGNPWTGLEIEALSVTGPGLDLSLEQLSIDYFLPALLTGALPLEIEAKGLVGALDLDRLQDLPSTGGGASLPIRPSLERLALSEVALAINDIPYTLPDFTVQELSLEQQGRELELTGKLGVQEASGSFDASIQLSPLSIRSELRDIDLRMVRHWWTGVQSGTASGVARYDNGEMTADLSVNDGVVDYLGATVHSIYGPVRYEDYRVSSELTGEALGGKLHAATEVDVRASRWRGDMDGNLALNEVADWLAGLGNTMSLDALNIAGRTDLSLEASGWSEVDLLGEVTGAGRVVGREVERVEGTFSYTTSEGLGFRADAAVAGNPLTVKMLPQPEGYDLTLQATSLPLIDKLVVDVSGDFERRPDRLEGTLVPVLSGTLAGREVNATAEAQLGEDGWQVFVEGEDSLGARLEGALVLTAVGLEGRTTLSSLRLPYLDGPLNLDVSTNGPLEALALALRVSAPRALGLESAGLSWQTDLRGRADALLSGAALSDIRLNLGSLTGSGGFDFSARAGRLDFDLQAARLSGWLAGSLRLQNGAVTLLQDGYRATGQVTSSALRGPVLSLPALDAPLELFVDDAAADAVRLTLSDPEQGLTVELADAVLGIQMDDYTVGLRDTPLLIRGIASYDLADTAENTSFDLSGRGADTTLLLRGNAARADLSVRAEPGSTLLSLPLAESLSLDGPLFLNRGRTELGGSLGAVPLALEAGYTAGGLDLTARLADTFSASLSGPLDELSWTSAGRLFLAPVAAAFGLSIDGWLESDLAYGGARFSGGVRGRLELAGTPIDLEIQGRNDKLLAEASTELFGEKMMAGGELWPRVDAGLELPYLGSVTLTGRLPDVRASGQGVVAAQTVSGLELPSLPWQIGADTAGKSANVTIGDSALDVAWDGDWRMEGRIEQEAGLGSLMLGLDAALSMSSALPGGSLNGALSVSDGGRRVAMPLSGSLSDLLLSGSVPADFIAEAADLPVDLAGRVDLEFTGSLFGSKSNRLEASWLETGQDLQATVSFGESSAKGIEASLAGENLTALWNGDRFRINARDFELGNLLASPVALARLSGDLEVFVKENAADGSLRLETSRPFESAFSLTGADEGLELSGSVVRPALLEVGGTLWPERRLELSAQAVGLTLVSRFSGYDIAGELRREATSTDLLKLTELSVPFSGSFENGLELEAKSDVFNLSLAEGQVSATLDLPLGFLGTPHRLSGSARGPLTAPEGTLSFSGPSLQGPLHFGAFGLAADLKLVAAPAIGPLEESRGSLRATMTPDFAWDASLDLGASLRGLALDLASSWRGQGLDYTVGGRVRIAEEAIPFELAGRGATVRADLSFQDTSLSPLASLLPIELSGAVQGDLSLHYERGELRALPRLSAEGLLAGEAFSLSARSPENGIASIEAFWRDAALMAQFLADNVSLSVSHPDLELAGWLTSTRPLEVVMRGTYKQQAVNARARFDSASYDGRLTATFADTEVEAKVFLTPSDQLRYSGAASFGSPLAGLNDLSLKLEGFWAEGVTRLESMNLRGRVQDEEFVASLGGSLWPSPTLTGELALADLLTEPVDLVIKEAPQAYLLQANYQAQTLAVDFSRRGELLSFALSGDASLKAPRSAAWSSDLTWQAAEGFTGAATLEIAALEDTVLTLDLSGAGDLSLLGRLERLGVPFAAADIMLSPAPWKDPALAGSVSLDARVEDLWAAWPGEALKISSELVLEGSLTQPSVGGPVSLSGALEAEGSLEADSAGGRFSLGGTGLWAAATLDQRGWLLEAHANRLNLSEALPLLGEPKLTADLEGGQTWQNVPHLTVESLLLESARSRVRGSLRYDDTLEGRLDLTVDLRDVTTAPPLKGRIEGPLSLGATSGGLSLDGDLALTGVGLQRADWRLSGRSVISGTLAAPEIVVSMRGEGTAEGEVSVTARPAESRYRIESDLSLGALSSDLSVSWASQVLEASGAVEYGDAGFSVLAPDRRSLVMEGRGDLNAWRLTLIPEISQLIVTGALEDLRFGAQGDMVLSANWQPQTNAWLTGEIEDLAYGSFSLGDVSIDSSFDVQRRATLSGPQLEAGVVLTADGVVWTVEHLTLPLDSGFELQLSASGRDMNGTATAVLNGAVSGEEIAVPLTLTLADNDLRLTSSAGLLGGRLELAGETLDGEWRGGVELADAQVAGGELSLRGSLSGTAFAPQINGLLAADFGAVESSGPLLLSPREIVAKQTLSSPYLSDPLELAGTLWPDLQLSLSDEAGANYTVSSGEQGSLVGAGDLAVDTGLVKATLRGGDDALAHLHFQAPILTGLGFEASLPSVPPKELAAMFSEGVTLRGTDATTGTLVAAFESGADLSLREVRYSSEIGTLDLSGDLKSRGTWSGRLTGNWQGNVEAERLPWLSALETLPFEVSLEHERVNLRAASEAGMLEAGWSFGETQLDVLVDMALDAGNAQLALSYTEETGPSGRLITSDMPLVRTPRFGLIRLDSDVRIGPERVEGTGRLAGLGGEAQLDGTIGWARLLPDEVAETIAPQADTASQLRLRLDRFNLAGLPWVREILPHLDTPVSGVAELQEGRFIGQFLSPDLTVFDTTLSASLELDGTFSKLNLRGKLGQSSWRGSYDGELLTGFVNLDRFPVQVLGEAFLGDTNVTSSLTGAARFDIPLGEPSASVVRFSSENLRLERDGVVTRGDVTVRFEAGRLVIEQASFSGDGVWQVSGQVGPDLLDLQAHANDANFSPLLGLIPAFSELELGARGSLTLQAAGSLRNPDIRMTSPELELLVGGSLFALQDAQVSLEDDEFRALATLEGLSPIKGTFSLEGKGRLSLLPLNQSELAFTLVGEGFVPILGKVESVEARLEATRGWQLTGRGMLGRPFTVTGTLNPLNLQMSGRGLNVSAHQYFLASSETDVSLNLTRPDDFVIAGAVSANAATIRTGLRDPSLIDPNRVPNPLYRRIRYDDIVVTVPNQVTFSENFGSAEMAVDLRLNGTVAEPTLDGEARALRGNLRFSGRDFAVENGVARFERSRGILPRLVIEAVTSFDKTRVLTGASALRYEFIEPKNSPNFDVALRLEGEFEQIQNLRRIDLKPTLTSNALLRERGLNGSGFERAARGTARPLSDSELISLLTLGQLELTGGLATQTGLAGSLAQNALDTAVDLFVLSGLQEALGDALGVDLIEIRTSSLSSLISGTEDEFGVSLRVGGYLSEDLFASYRLGRYSDPDQAYAINNEFSLQYDLGPVDLRLSGGLNFAETELSPSAAFGIGLGYAFTPELSFETGLELSEEQQSARFGVSIRW